MMEEWNVGIMGVKAMEKPFDSRFRARWWSSLRRTHYSTIPTFHYSNSHSIIPSFHYSIRPIFTEKG
jgi:hypothetical protein